MPATEREISRLKKLPAARTRGGSGNGKGIGQDLLGGTGQVNTKSNNRVPRLDPTEVTFSVSDHYSGDGIYLPNMVVGVTGGYHRACVVSFVMSIG